MRLGTRRQVRATGPCELQVSSVGTSMATELQLATFQMREAGTELELIAAFSTKWPPVATRTVVG